MVNDIRPEMCTAHVKSEVSMGAVGSRDAMHSTQPPNPLLLQQSVFPPREGGEIHVSQGHVVIFRYVAAIL